MIYGRANIYVLIQMEIVFFSSLCSNYSYVKMCIYVINCLPNFL